MKVFKVMTPDVQLCTPEDSLKDAAEAMAALDIGLLPVAEDDRLVGMISDRGSRRGRGTRARNQDP